MADNIIEVIDSGGTVVDVVDEGAGPEVAIIDGEKIIDVIGATGQQGIPGENLVLSYAPSGELTSVEALPSGKVTSLAYDGSGRLDTVTNYKGIRTLGYDAEGVLTSVTWS